jgi:hypothetical protein
MRIGTYIRITKREWYALGALANNRLFRRADKRGYWRYYMEVS